MRASSYHYSSHFSSRRFKSTTLKKTQPPLAHYTCSGAMSTDRIGVRTHFFRTLGLEMAPQVGLPKGCYSHEYDPSSSSIKVHQIASGLRDTATTVLLIPERAEQDLLQQDGPVHPQLRMVQIHGHVQIQRRDRALRLLLVSHPCLVAMTRRPAVLA